MSALLTREGAQGARGLHALDLPPEEEARTPPHLRSPAERVLRALYDLYPAEGDWLARAPLLHSAPLTAAEWGLLKVAGKRAALTPEGELRAALRAALHAPAAAPAAPPLRPARVYWQREGAPPFADLRAAAEWLMGVARARNEELWAEGGGQADLGAAAGAPAAGAPAAGAPAAGDPAAGAATAGAATAGVPAAGAPAAPRRWRGARRVVAAALLTPQLTPLLYALNQPEVSRTYHAEWAVLDGALRALWGERAGEARSPEALSALWSSSEPLTLLCTLKPCKMCAGAWVTYGPAAPLRVVYVEDDLGRLAQHTAFDAGSDAWRAAGEWGGGLARLG